MLVSPRGSGLVGTNSHKWHKATPCSWLLLNVVSSLSDYQVVIQADSPHWDTGDIIFPQNHEPNGPLFSINFPVSGILL